MYQTVKSHPDYSMYSFQYWHYYVDAFKLLLSESRRRGHGGTIIWLPEYAIPQAEKFISPGHKVWDKEGESDNLFQRLLKFRKQFDTAYDRAFTSEFKDAESLYLMHTSV
jgi:hypothetical protein